MSSLSKVLDISRKVSVVASAQQQANVSLTAQALIDSMKPAVEDKFVNDLLTEINPILDSSFGVNLDAYYFSNEPASIVKSKSSGNYADFTMPMKYGFKTKAQISLSPRILSKAFASVKSKMDGYHAKLQQEFNLNDFSTYTNVYSYRHNPGFDKISAVVPKSISHFVLDCFTVLNFSTSRARKGVYPPEYPARCGDFAIEKLEDEVAINLTAFRLVYNKLVSLGYKPVISCWLTPHTSTSSFLRRKPARAGDEVGRLTSQVGVHFRLTLSTKGEELLPNGGCAGYGPYVISSTKSQAMEHARKNPKAYSFFQAPGFVGEVLTDSTFSDVSNGKRPEVVLEAIKKMTNIGHVSSVWSSRYDALSTVQSDLSWLSKNLPRLNVIM